MNEDQRERCLHLLRRCRTGDEFAYDQLTREVASHFGWMIAHYAVSDPAIDREDLTQQFRLGIWRAIAEVDTHIGDPIYFLAWKGRKEVLTLIKLWKRRRLGADTWTIGSLDEMMAATAHEPANDDLNTDPEYALAVVAEREDASQRLAHLLATVALTPRQQEAWEWMAEHADDLELLSNLNSGVGRQMATALGVSEQMASKFRKQIAERMVAVG